MKVLVTGAADYIRQVVARPLPNRFEIFHFFHDRPGERFSIEKAKRVLGFRPQFNCDQLWRLGV